MRLISRDSVALLLRVLSYAAVLVATGLLAADRAQHPVAPCQNMSCAGTGIGALMALVVMPVLAGLVGLALNLMAYLLQQPPRSDLRKVELCAILLSPVLLAPLVWLLTL